MQEIVNDIGRVTIDIVPQYVTGKTWSHVGQNLVWDIKFGQISISEHPRHLESDDNYTPLFPHDARLRNLTYSTEVFADITFSKKELDDVFILNEVSGEREKKVKRIITETTKKRVHIGRIPVMLRSRFCQLKKLNEMTRVKNGKDCCYDQGGYFIINGSEKVIVA